MVGNDQLCYSYTEIIETQHSLEVQSPVGRGKVRECLTLTVFVHSIQICEVVGMVFCTSSLHSFYYQLVLREVVILSWRGCYDSEICNAVLGKKF